MRKSIVAVVAIGIAASPVAQADPDAWHQVNYSITLNGKDITQYAVNMARVHDFNGNTTIGCKANGNESLAIGDNVVWVEPGGKVTKVDLRDGSLWEYFPASKTGWPQPGDAQYVLDGKTYKITGHISPYSTSRVPANPTPPVPFTFNVTCP